LGLKLRVRYINAQKEAITMKYIKHYQCTECGKTYTADIPMNLCEDDGRPVKMMVDVTAIAQDYPSMTWYQPHVKNMWRFGPLLPFDISTDADSICTLGEGHTPIIDISQYSACAELNLQVYLKDEGQPYAGYGANPTGSFKDRGMSVVATMAHHYGLSSLAVPTQGNAGDSLSEYGVAVDLNVAVIMPDDTPMPIMGKVAAYSLQHAGISLDLVKGTIREAGALMKQKYLPEGYFNCATFQEPGWRIEGKKTMGLELAEPWPKFKPQWSLPDAILYPTGGGTGILGSL
jgi:threonine synthase